MLMREWRRGYVLQRWLAGKWHARLLMAVGLVLAGFSVVIAVSFLIADEPAAPWLSSDEDNGEFLLNIIAGAVIGGSVGFLGGFAHAVVDARRKRHLAVVQSSRPSPSDRGFTAYTLGIKWLFTGWRLWTIGLALMLSFAVYISALFMPETRDRVMDKTSGDVLFMNVFAAVWMVWALVLKGREIQRGKERIKVADEYLAIHEARLSEEFAERQQAWQAEKTAQLYEQILDQQARGILPCPNCRGHGEHKKTA